MKIFIFFCLAALSWSQTASYPGAVVTDQQLKVVANNCQTIITFPVSASDTTINVANGACIPANSIVTIDSENISICASSGNQLTVGTTSCPNAAGRGFDGTSAVAHSATGANCNPGTASGCAAVYIDAWHHNSMSAEVKAIETALGPNLGNITIANPLPQNKGGTGTNNPLSGPLVGNGANAFTAVTCAAGQFLRARNTGGPVTYDCESLPSSWSGDYNFTAQQPGGTLTGGTGATVSLTPCPRGVAGSDSLHRLYVSGGTGTAEAVLITGGTCTSGAASGTVIFTPANAHSGAWTIQSASGGIFEAAEALGLAGAVLLNQGTSNIYGTLVLPTTISLIGQGTGINGPARGSTLSCAAAANPCLVVADGLGSATGQGIGMHSGYLLTGQNSGSGLWIGGDPAGVFAPASWFGSYLRFTSITVNNFANALTIQNANFTSFLSSVFSGATLALLIPSTASYNNLGNQPLGFYDCLLSVPGSNAVEMDVSGFVTSSLLFTGGQVSGAITGAAVDWQSYGTHYEPNAANVGIVNLSGAQAGVIKIHGGLISVHGSGLTSVISMNGSGFYTLEVRDVTIQCDSGATVPQFIYFSSSTGGALSLESINVNQAGTFTNLYTLAGSQLQYYTLLIDLWQESGIQSFAAAATTTWPAGNYPARGIAYLTGATVTGSGITAVSGLLTGQWGVLKTQNAQTFTAGATIGNTLTTTAGTPYTYYYDGAKIYLK